MGLIGTVIITALLISGSLGFQRPKRPYKPLPEEAETRSLVLDSHAKPELLCYDADEPIGNVLKLVDYANDLSTMLFNNRASFCCANGIWLLYDKYDYNIGDLFSEQHTLWGEKHCAHLGTFSNMASSARFVGAPESYKLDTLNFYEGSFFRGEEQFFYSSDPRVPKKNFGKSMIITGCHPWTIYSGHNYRGYAVCIYPSDPAKCQPAFFPDLASLGMSRRIGSVRRGCFAKKVVNGGKVNF